MVYLLLATIVALLGFAFARSASPATVDALNQFGNAAGILNRVLTAVDSVRLVADWFANRGGQGFGPLTVPAPVVGGGRPPGVLGGSSPGWKPPPATRPTTWAGLAGPDRYDPYADDPVGRQLGLPPRMDPTQPPDAILGQ